MERFVIEQFEGTNRNAAEGVTPAPEAIKNLYAARSGGLKPIGGKYTVLIDSASVTLSGNSLIAYDEASLALFSGGQALVNNQVESLTGSQFLNEGSLSVAPRSGILTPWARAGTGYSGAAYFLRTQDTGGAFTLGEGTNAPTFTPTNDAGGPIPNGTVMSFAWIVEAPTDNGLVVHGVATANYTASAVLASLTVTLNQVYEKGTVARFYMSDSTQSTYERFDVKVSDGETAMVATLDSANFYQGDSGAWLPTSEAIVNFGGGRLEAHNRRMWGRAGETLFLPFLDSSVVSLADAYFYFSGSGWEADAPYGEVGSGDMGLNSATDYVELVIKELRVVRLSATQDVIVPLFMNAHDPGSNRAMWGVLRWDAKDQYPMLEVFYTADTSRYHPFMTKYLTSGNLVLPTIVNSSLTLSGVTLRFTIDSFAVASANGIDYLTTSSSYSLDADSPAFSETGINTSGYFLMTEVTRRLMQVNLPASYGVSGLSAFYWNGSSLLPLPFGNASTPLDTVKTLVYGEDAGSFYVGHYLRIRATSIDAEYYEFVVGWQFTSPQVKYVDSLFYRIDANDDTGFGVFIYIRGYRSGVEVFRYTTVAAGAKSGTIPVKDTVQMITVTSRNSSPTGVLRFNNPYLNVTELRPISVQLSTANADWNTYRAANATQLSIARTPSWFEDGSGFLNYREMKVTSMETGDSAGILAFGSVDDYVSGTSWTSSETNAETWNIGDTSYIVRVYEAEDVNTDTDPVLNRNLTLVFSDTGSVNRGKATNFLTFSPLSSESITALASTPAGLLVFMENETFLVRGDPASGDLSSQRLSGTMGCDTNVIPARLGSVVMPIYKGEVYAINLGGGDVDFGGTLVNISKPVWLPDDPFVQVIGEHSRNHVVARTQLNKVFRMDTETQQWIVDPFDGDYINFLLPASLRLDYGTRYFVSDVISHVTGNPVTPGVMRVVSPDVIDTPVLEWDAIDAGDKNLMKLWRRVELFTNGVDTTAPVLTYTCRGVIRESTGLEQGRGRWVFTLARGVVGETLGLEFSFPGATDDLVIEPPVVVEYVPRYRER